MPSRARPLHFNGEAQLSVHQIMRELRLGRDGIRGEFQKGKNRCRVNV